MKNRVSCPQCGGACQLPASGAGQRVRCPHCSAVFTASVAEVEPTRRSRVGLVLVLAACTLVGGALAAAGGGLAVWWWLRPVGPTGAGTQAGPTTSGHAQRDTGSSHAEEDLREARRRSQKNLEQIALAFHSFHDSQGSMPPSLLIDQTGQNLRPSAPGKPPTSRPLLSWRVLLLPYLDEDKLYREFKLDEPWDSPHNKKLLARMPAIYAPVGGKAAEPFTTYYQVFTGPATPFPPPPPPQFGRPPGAPPDTKYGGMSLARIGDGTSNTFLVVEAGEPVPWTKPADLEYDDKKPLPQLGGLFPDGFHAAFCDARVLFVPSTLKEDTLRAMVTSFGGEPIDRGDVLREQLRKGMAPLFRGKDAAAWLEQMASSDADRRLEAVKGLTEMVRDMAQIKEARPQVEAGQKALLRAVKDGDGAVVFEAVRSLGSLDLDADVVVPVLLTAFVDVEEATPAEITQHVLARGQRAASALGKALEDDDFEVRARAAFLLHEMGRHGQLDEKGWQGLLERDDRIQQALAQEKGQAVSLEEVLTLLEALHEKAEAGPGPGIARVQAAQVLSRTASFGPLAIPHLCRNSRQEAFLIRAQIEAGASDHLRAERAERDPVLSAVEALGDAGAEGVRLRLAQRLLPELLLHLRRFPPDPSLRREVVQALGRIGPAARAAAGDIERLLKDPEERMRLQAAEALVQIDPGRREKVVPVLAELERSRDDFVAIDAALLLARQDAADRATVEALVRSSSDPGHALQNRLSQVVGQLERLSPRAGKTLAKAGRPLLQSKDAHVRRTAALLLAPFDLAACLPGLREGVKEASGDELKEVGLLLKRLGPKARDLFPALRARLQETERETGLRAGFFNTGRSELVDALVAVDPEAALPLLVKLWRTQPGKNEQGWDLTSHYLLQLDAFNALRQMGPRLEKILPTLLEDVQADEADTDRERGLARRLSWMQPISPARSGMLLARIGPMAVPALLEVSKHRSPVVQARAVLILADMGANARAAVPRLLEMLKAGKAPIRPEVVRALGRIDPHGRKVAQALIAQRQDKEVEVRRQAARALGGVGTDALDALTESLKDADANVCLAATAALGRLGTAALPALRTAVQHKSTQVRRMAVLALGNQGPQAPGAVDGLLEAVKDRDPETRCLALALLARPGPHSGEVVAVLAGALGDVDSRVRWSAAFTLEELGQDAGAAAAALGRALSDANRPVRRRALLALRALGPKAGPALAEVQKLLLQPEENVPQSVEEDLSEDAALTLLRIAPEPAPLLADILKAAPQGRREAVTRALLRLGPPGIPVLLKLTEAGDADVRVRAILCLAQSEAPADTLVPRLIGLLDDGNILVRRQAAQALGGLGPQARAAREPLRNIAGNQQDLARETASKALEAIGGP